MRNYAVNSAQVSFIQRFTEVFMFPEGISYSRRFVRPYVRVSVRMSARPLFLVFDGGHIGLFLYCNDQNKKGSASV